MRIRDFAIIAGLVTPYPSIAFCEKLPVKDGYYIRVGAPCANAPMVMRTDIVRGVPLARELVCEVVKHSAHIYIAICKAPQTNVVIRYTIVSETEFEERNDQINFQDRKRWCGKR
jgi:hypothetical protein